MVVMKVDVYKRQPVSGHPAYRINRNITVKEPETEEQSERASESTVNVDNDTGDTEQSLSLIHI